LCNNDGVNGQNTSCGWWSWRDKYKEMRKKSRKKDASDILKKLVKDLKKYELKNQRKINRDYKNSLTENEKVKDIVCKYKKIRLKRHNCN
tara:strand:+ start:302 stop:571 length:270 start_codon:yes stop_codon:yes gene_type:complete